MNTGQRRLVVVSNRVSVTSDAARSGGLAVALSELLKRTGGVWFGWSGNKVEQRVQQADLDTATRQKVFQDARRLVESLRAAMQR